MILSWILLVALAGGLTAALGAQLGPAEALLPSLGAIAIVLAARRARRGHYRALAVVAGFAEGIVRPSGIFLLPIVFCVLGALVRATRGPLPARSAVERFVLGAVAHAVFLLVEGAVFAGLGTELPPRFGNPIGWGLGALFLAGVLQVLAEAALDRTPRLKRGIERVR